MDFPNCELWDFSRAIYSQPEVEACCLYLQDHHGANVNLLLLACWVGASGRGVLEAERFTELEHQVAVWQQQVIQPLRQVRQQLKAMSGYGDETIRQLRRKVLDCELDAEHREQLMLERSLEPFHLPQEMATSQAFNAAATNLYRYLAHLGLHESERDTQVERLLQQLQRLQAETRLQA